MGQAPSEALGKIFSFLYQLLHMVTALKMCPSRVVVGTLGSQEKKQASSKVVLQKLNYLSFLYIFTYKHFQYTWPPPQLPLVPEMPGLLRQYDIPMKK